MGDGKDKKFISERILGRDLSFGRALRVGLVSVLCGAVFGGAAFGVYYLGTKKVREEETAKIEASLAAREQALEEAEKVSVPETAAPETEPVTEPAGDAGKPENDPDGSIGETEGNTEETEEESDPLEPEQSERVRELIAEDREGYVYSQEDLGRILGTQSDACADISRYVVKVSCFISETTWFESTVETERTYAGIIVSADEQEVLILTVDDAAGMSDGLKVTFHDGTVKDAEIKKTAKRDGWTVLSVPVTSLSPSLADSLEAVETVLAEELTPGIPVISAGAPLGPVNSYGFGYIGYVAEPESEVDSSSVYCYSEAQSHPATGTFLMTVDGRLIGLGVEKNKDSNTAGNCFRIAESCSMMLENLKKGNDSAWLGITGTDIPENMKEKLPEGMYVTDVEEDGPAYAAGLKRGDIIVGIGPRDINGLSDYLSFMRNLRPGETISMTVCRETAHADYRELEMEMTAGTR